MAVTDQVNDKSIKLYLVGLGPTHSFIYIACNIYSVQTLLLYLVRFEGRQLGESRGFFCNSNSCKSGLSMQVLKDYAGEDEQQKRVFHWRHFYCTAYMSYVSSTTPLFCTALSKVKDQSEIRFEKHCPFLLLEHGKK